MDTDNHRKYDGNNSQARQSQSHNSDSRMPPSEEEGQPRVSNASHGFDSAAGTDTGSSEDAGGRGAGMAPDDDRETHNASDAEATISSKTSERSDLLDVLDEVHEIISDIGPSLTCEEQPFDTDAAADSGDQSIWDECWDRRSRQQRDHWHQWQQQRQQQQHSQHRLSESVAMDDMRRTVYERKGGP